MTPTPAFDEERAESLMREVSRFGRLVHVASCSSTQDLALASDLDAASGPDDAVYLADHQTAGRGRQQREWHDEPGVDLLATFRFRQRLPSPSALPAALPAAIVRALEPFAGRELRIKWPNDVYLDGRKLCGMLIDSGVAGTDTYLVGVGINCNRVRFPPDLEVSATSLALATGHEIDRVALLVTLAQRIDEVLRRIVERDLDDLLALFRDRLGLIGRAVEVTTDTTRRGRLTAIDFTRLVLDGDHEVPLGFVRRIRAAP